MNNGDMPSVTYWVAKTKTHSVEVRAWFNGEAWMWNVYAHVFESHPMFNDNELLKLLPLHGGCTFDEQKIVQPLGGCNYDWQSTRKSKTVGSDYHHIWDDYNNHPNPFDVSGHKCPSPFIGHANDLNDALLKQLEGEEG